MSDFHFVMVVLDANASRGKEEFEEQLNKANDWIEFRPNSWLVWTKQTSKTWYARLKPTLGEDDSIFICAVEITDRAGWMPRSFWNFVNNKSKK